MIDNTAAGPRGPGWAERFRGMMLGGAVGDALGAGVRDRSSRDIQLMCGPRGIAGYLSIYGRPGAVTDLTQLTAFTLEGMLRARVLGMASPDEVIEANHVSWLYTQGVPWEFAMRRFTQAGFDVAGWLLNRSELYSTRNPGGEPLRAVTRLAAAGQPTEARPGEKWPLEALCWSAPAMVWQHEDPVIDRVARRITGLTESTVDVQAAAALHAQLLSRLARGVPVWDAVRGFDRRDGTRLPASLQRTVHAAVYTTSGGRRPAPVQLDIEFDIQHGPGELGIALASVLCTTNFADAVCMAVNTSADSCVTGALAGQLAGAVYGARGIPAPWLDEVELREVIETLCHDAAEAFAPPPPANPPRWARRYLPDQQVPEPLEITAQQRPVETPAARESSVEQTMVLPVIDADLAEPPDSTDSDELDLPVEVTRTWHVGNTIHTTPGGEPRPAETTQPFLLPKPAQVGESAIGGPTFPAPNPSGPEPGTDEPESPAVGEQRNESPARHFVHDPGETSVFEAIPAEPEEDVDPPEASGEVAADPAEVAEDDAAPGADQIVAPIGTDIRFDTADLESAVRVGQLLPVPDPIAPDSEGAAPTEGALDGPEPEGTDPGAGSTEQAEPEAAPAIVFPTDTDPEDEPDGVDGDEGEPGETTAPADTADVENPAESESPVESGNSVDSGTSAEVDESPAADAADLPAPVEPRDLAGFEEPETSAPDDDADPDDPETSEDQDDVGGASIVPFRRAEPDVTRPDSDSTEGSEDDTPPSLTERVLGCFLGGALGDALGADLEFISAEEIAERFGSSGPSGLREAYGVRGAITDDTQMSLFTAEGLIRASVAERTYGGEDAVAHVQLAYQRWLHTQGVDWEAASGPFHADHPGADGWLVKVPGLFSTRGPGKTVFRALTRFAAGGPAGSLTESVNDSKGCGGVMRAAPVALYSADPTEVFELAVRTAALTHGNPAGYHSAGALAVIVQQALLGQSLDDGVWLALQVLETWEGHEETSAMLEAAVDLASYGLPTPQQLEETLGGGWVGEEALAIAVCAALVGGENVETALRVAVNHSGDSDSTGAICGNIVGALLGVRALPVEWLVDLELREVIEQVAWDCVAEFGVGEFLPDLPADTERPLGADWADRYPVRPLSTVWRRENRPESTSGALRAVPDEPTESRPADFPSPKPSPRRVTGLNYEETTFGGERR